MAVAEMEARLKSALANSNSVLLVSFSTLRHILLAFETWQETVKLILHGIALDSARSKGEIGRAHV